MDKLYLKRKDKDYNTKRKFNILIIDDNEEISELMKYYLENRGHNITILNDGTQGLYRIIKFNYDIIFLDYHLYNNNIINGSEICKLSREYNNKSLIFGYTEDHNKEIINDFKSSGTNGIFFKPIDINALNNFMNKLENEQYIRPKKDNSIILF